MSSFGQGGVAFFPFINGQIVDVAGISSMMPYTLGLAGLCSIIWIILPSPAPAFAFIAKWRQRGIEKTEQSSEKETITIA
jgi:hypothetical protein